jgi:hypothetical protein
VRLEHLLSGRRQKEVPGAARRKPSKSRNTSFLEEDRKRFLEQLGASQVNQGTPPFWKKR